MGGATKYQVETFATRLRHAPRAPELAAHEEGGVESEFSFRVSRGAEAMKCSPPFTSEGGSVNLAGRYGRRFRSLNQRPAASSPIKDAFLSRMRKISSRPTSGTSNSTRVMPASR
jgi:hypothetical protein